MFHQPWVFWPRRLLSSFLWVLLVVCVVSVVVLDMPRAHGGRILSAARAQLIQPLDEHAVQGQSFFLSTMTPWQTGDCRIPVNTRIEGEIEGRQLRKDGAKQEGFKLRFKPLSCTGSETIVITPVLVAVRGPLKQLEDAGLGAAERRQAMDSAMANRALAGAGGAAGRAEDSAQNQNLSLSGQGQSQIQDTSAFETGEVRNMHGVHMVLPLNGADAATELTSAHSFVLPAGTQFFLMFLPPGSGGLIRRKP